MYASQWLTNELQIKFQLHKVNLVKPILTIKQNISSRKWHMIKIKKSRTCHHVSLEVHHIGFQPKNLALNLRLYQQTWRFPSSPQVQLHIYPLPAQKTMNLTIVIIKLKLADRFDNAFFFWMRILMKNTTMLENHLYVQIHNNVRGYREKM